jgi:hypothetical protein
MSKPVVLLLALTALPGCVHRGGAFDAYYGAARWSEASAAFLADSSLMNDERALYRAGILYGTPGRPTYRPERADSLLRRLISRFPGSDYRRDATERVAALDALVRERDSVSARMHAIEQRVADLTTAAGSLRRQLDSLTVQSDSLRRSTSRLEADLRDRDEQLRAARLELQRLKEIDLKTSRPPGKPPR